MSFAELSESLNWFFPRTKQCLDINPCVILSFLSRFLLLRNDDTSWKERKDKNMRSQMKAKRKKSTGINV